MLNPYFLNSAASEQRLYQNLVNEHLKIHGVEIIYIPRKFVRKETIVREVSSSRFDDNFSLEAYVNNYDGYSNAGDLLSKIGVTIKDDVTLSISKDRFSSFIAPFLELMHDLNPDELELFTRPREGDMIYFPLGPRLFEVKFVEHEKPFYALGELYTYELNCELFEYEDEVIDTGLDEVDKTVQSLGYITSLTLMSIGEQATANAQLTSGYINKIYLNNDGYDYVFNPIVGITSAPTGGTNASAVAITTSVGGTYSVKEIILINAGAGYTITPQISIIGGGGVGASATCGIITNYRGVQNVIVTNPGTGYINPPEIIFSSPTEGPAIAATFSANVNKITTGISSIFIVNPGVGFSSFTNLNLTISPPTIIAGIGTYQYNEIVVGSVSGTQARVRSWDATTNTLEVSINDGDFYAGEVVVGSESGAEYGIYSYNNYSALDKYQDNDTIQTEASEILDSSRNNPFGIY
jgi:hypothetical protein